MGRWNHDHGDEIVEWQVQDHIDGPEQQKT